MYRRFTEARSAVLAQADPVSTQAALCRLLPHPARWAAQGQRWKWHVCRFSVDVCTCQQATLVPPVAITCKDSQHVKMYEVSSTLRSLTKAQG